MNLTENKKSSHEYIVKMRLRCQEQLQIAYTHLRTREEIIVANLILHGPKSEENRQLCIVKQILRIETQV